MATKGEIRVLGVLKDGLWVVDPCGSNAVDVLAQARRSGVTVRIALAAPVTASGRAKRPLRMGELRLAGTEDLDGGKAPDQGRVPR